MSTRVVTPHSALRTPHSADPARARVLPLARAIAAAFAGVTCVEATPHVTLTIGYASWPALRRSMCRAIKYCLEESGMDLATRGAAGAEYFELYDCLPRQAEGEERP